MKVDEYQTVRELLLEERIENLIQEYKIEWNKYVGYVYEVATPYFDHWLSSTIDVCDLSTKCEISE